MYLLSRKFLYRINDNFAKIMITGPANCGKTFELEPLEYIFQVFSNQANEKCAFDGSCSELLLER